MVGTSRRYSMHPHIVLTIYHHLDQYIVACQNHQQFNSLREHTDMDFVVSISGPWPNWPPHLPRDALTPLLDALSYWNPSLLPCFHGHPFWTTQGHIFISITCVFFLSRQCKCFAWTRNDSDGREYVSSKCNENSLHRNSNSNERSQLWRETSQAHLLADTVQSNVHW